MEIWCFKDMYRLKVVSSENISGLKGLINPTFKRVHNIVHSHKISHLFAACSGVHCYCQSTLSLCQDHLIVTI